MHYEDYVKIEPATDAAFHVSDDTLCASGLAYGANYKVTVLKGLPSIYDEKLDVSEEFSVAIGDRAPSVGFSGYNYILPKVDQNGIPLVTVNVNEVKLRLLRITDRNLVQQIYQGRLFRGIDGYETSQLRDEMGEELWSGQLDHRWRAQSAQHHFDSDQRSAAGNEAGNLCADRRDAG